VVTRADRQRAIPPAPQSILATSLRELLRLSARLLAPAQVTWLETAPSRGRRVYFANHTSHADYLLLWAALPRSLRQRVRPVAAADYWYASRVRRFIIDKVFRAVAVDRRRTEGTNDAIDAMASAIRRGDSLIIFPEGCRNASAAMLLPFKSGLYRLACLFPEIELIPVWLGNVGRALPKGAVIPVPLLCTVTFGPALRLRHGEAKEAFLHRAHHALRGLAVARPAESVRSP